MNKKYSRISRVLTSISKQPLPSHSLLTLSLTTVSYSTNFLYYKLPNCQLNRLHLLKNSFSRNVVKVPPILISLHWLKINESI